MIEFTRHPFHTDQLPALPFHCDVELALARNADLTHPAEVRAIRESSMPTTSFERYDLRDSTLLSIETGGRGVIEVWPAVHIAAGEGSSIIAFVLECAGAAETLRVPAQILTSLTLHPRR